MPILLALFLVLAMVHQGEAVEGTQPAAPVSVKADVLYWEGEELIVREITGHEMRLRVTGQTKVEGAAGGRVKTGEKIVAQVTPEGLALSIAVQIPDSAGGVSQPSAR